LVLHRLQQNPRKWTAINNTWKSREKKEKTYKKQRAPATQDATDERLEEGGPKKTKKNKLKHVETKSAGYSDARKGCSSEGQQTGDALAREVRGW